jgi:UDP-N-acetyl-2-amino-2-deoxyglucuronate dehydrogenase
MNDSSVRFALLGAAGYVAPRHMKAMRETGNELVAACDPHDGVGVLDRYFPDCKFFTAVERFDRHLEKLRRRDERVSYVTICSPNYLHDAHCRLALRVRANAICEKPLVINPWNLDQLTQLEEEHGRRIFTILQLRLHPEVIRLREKLQASTERVQVNLTYATHRGPWYKRSWKGDARRSGTLAMNIGVFERDDELMRGELTLKRADVTWLLSTSAEHVPEHLRKQGQRAYRALTMGTEQFDFTTGFDDLHTRSYEEILAGNGFSVEDARPSVELVYKLRTCDLSKP